MELFAKALCLVLVISVVLSFASCNKVPSQDEISSAVSSFEPLTSFEDVSADTCSQTVSKEENIEELFKGHYLFERQGLGGCDKLAGDVVITVVLVDTEDSVWDNEGMSAFEARIDDACKNLIEWGKEYNQEVSFSIVYKKVQMDCTSEMASVNNNIEEILQRAGLPSRYRLNHALREEYNSDEAPVLICPYASDRSGTYYFTDMPCAYSIVSGKKIHTYTVEHELLHQFGARDYYYPANTEKAAQDIFPDSIMMKVTGDVVMDDFTAYLIGWTDKITPQGRQLLEKTADNIESDSLTVDFGDDTTGHFSNRTVSVGKYTGYVENGLAQGEGVFVRVGGETYTGNFVDGKRCGYGVSVKPNGEKYEGEWENNLYNGQGTYYYSDGSVKHKGTFKNGEFAE